MRLPAASILFLAACLCSGCAGGQRLKTPCALPASALSYGADDCGPLLPVNRAFLDVMQPAP
ncbi:MAG: hypothetical protein ACRECY_03880 [Phyllobacterium sp.]